VGVYPTQAKKRLEWGTQPLLLVQGGVPATKGVYPTQAKKRLEWDNTALDQGWWMDKASTTAALDFDPSGRGWRLYSS
jgi:hypothetical protein